MLQRVRIGRPRLKRASLSSRSRVCVQAELDPAISEARPRKPVCTCPRQLTLADLDGWRPSDTKNSFARAVALTDRPRCSRLSISFFLIVPDGPCINKK